MEISLWEVPNKTVARTSWWDLKVCKANSCRVKCSSTKLVRSSITHSRVQLGRVALDSQVHSLWTDSCNTVSKSKQHLKPLNRPSIGIKSQVKREGQVRGDANNLNRIITSKCNLVRDNSHTMGEVVLSNISNLMTIQSSLSLFAKCLKTQILRPCLGNPSSCSINRKIEMLIISKRARWRP